MSLLMEKVPRCWGVTGKVLGMILAWQTSTVFPVPRCDLSARMSQG